MDSWSYKSSFSLVFYSIKFVNMSQASQVSDNEPLKPQELGSKVKVKKPSQKQLFEEAQARKAGAAAVAEWRKKCEAEEEEASAGVSARAGAKGGKAAKKKAERKPLDPAYVTVGIMGLAVLSLAAMIWMGRSILLEMWPGISGFYKSVGVEAARPGDGLKIAESSKRLQRIGGVETLVVRGFISNISELPAAVPNLRLELYNEKREVIQDSGAKAPVGLLDPSGSVEFEIRMELPQLNLAKGGYGVVWAQ